MCFCTVIYQVVSFTGNELVVIQQELTGKVPNRDKGVIAFALLVTNDPQ